MTRIATAGLAFALLAAPAVLAAEADAKKLEGSYEVLSMTVDGKAEPKLEKEKPKFILKDGSITVEGVGKSETAKYTVDPSKTPAEIDIMPQGKDEKVPGIYATKETDKGLELTLVFAKGPNGSVRPKDFKGEGEGVAVLKLLRPKAK